MSTSSVLVSIGRGRPCDKNYLTQQKWATFRLSLFDTLKTWGPISFETSGVSTSPEWGEEESYTVGAYILNKNISVLQEPLMELAVTFNQDAIALTVGKTTLVRNPNV